MKIAYIPSGDDPYNKHSWSGTDYYACKALENQGHEVYCIYNFHPNLTLGKVVRKLYNKLFGHSIDVRRTIDASKQWAEYISKHLEPGTEAIFSLGTIKVAFLETNIPIFIMVDSIYEMHRSTYGGSGTKWFINEANELEQRALDKCAKVIPCSIETGKFIHSFYHISEDKIEIVPLGANWDKAPDEDYVLKQLNERLKQDTCNLLFVGVNWERKGADIVIETINELNRRKFPVELSLVGLKDIPTELPDNVHNYGFISKETKEGSEQLKELYSTAHFLFVPSIAEAYGLVFCEANAYAVPNISHRVGGLITIVEDGINGKLFEFGTSPKIFADYIEKTFNNKAEYERLCHSSLDRYKTILNWDVSGRKLSSIVSSQIQS